MISNATKPTRPSYASCSDVKIRRKRTAGPAARNFVRTFISFFEKIQFIMILSMLPPAAPVITDFIGLHRSRSLWRSEICTTEVGVSVLLLKDDDEY